MLPVAKSTLLHAALRGERRRLGDDVGGAVQAGDLPGATSAAKSHVMLPGPQPTSSTDTPG